MDEEEVVLLEEQLAAAHGDIERLQDQIAGLLARDAGRDATAQELAGQLRASRDEAVAAQDLIAAQAEDIERLRTAVSAAESQAGEAVSRYRQLVLDREPHLPADLVTGASVNELDAAIERARQTVAQVRQHLEQQAQAVRVPSGAPIRGPSDAGDLSPAEKIRLGLQKA